MTPEGKYPVFGANGIIGRYDQFNHESPELLVTCRGATCGSVNISLPKSWITGNAMVIRPKNGDIETRFLEYLFRGGLDISSAITGAAQPQITRTSLIPVAFSYPSSKEEQKRIVAILDDAFECIDTAIANTKRNLANARELFESYVNNIFIRNSEGLKHDVLSNMCTFENGDRGKNYPGRKAFVPSGVPFINAGHLLDDGTIDFENMNFISEQRFNILSNGKVKRGDVLFCLRGSLGKFGLVEFNGKGAIASSLVIVRPGKGIKPRYLGLFFASKACRKQIDGLSNGAAQPNLSARSLGQFRLPVLESSEQDFVIEHAYELKSSVVQLTEVVCAKLERLTELKQSLLQKAFSGELTTDFNPDALEH